MVKVDFGKKKLNILALGAHCDDIEIGCGGTLLKLSEQYSIQSVKWVVFCSNELRKPEAEAGAKAFLENIQNKEINIESFRDGFLPYVGYEVKDYFENIKKSFNPDLIFTHMRFDLHQDHRLLCELTWNTFRNHIILEYEILKYDGDLGSPNFFVPLEDKFVNRKISLLMKCYKSQSEAHWFDEETFKAILRIRGIESATSNCYAEAFYSRKLIL